MGSLISICGWCGRTASRELEPDAPEPLEITHTICLACFVREMRSFRRERRTWQPRRMEKAR
jgi:hypothetical protein